MTATCEAHGVNLHTPRRYPLQPLADQFPTESLSALCARLKVSGTTYQHYACHGILAKTADLLATRAGVPVYSVWPEMVDHVIAEAKRPCDECDAMFMPTRPGHRFCSPRCAKRNRQRVWQRRRYQTDPQFRERLQVRSARHYSEVRGYRVQQMREYRRRTKEHAA